MSAYQSLIAKMETGLDKFGLMTGNNAITKRLVAGAIIGGLLVTYFKPNVMFENGIPRPWAPFSGEKDVVKSTWFPWWLVPVIFSIFLGVLI